MNLRSEKGFSLIEVMIALLILAGGIMVVGNAWSGNFNRLQKSRINNTMAVLLQRKMTEIEIQVQDHPNDELKDEDSGTFDDYPGYKWKMASQEFEMPDLTPAFKAGQGQKADPMLETAAQQLTSFISKMVKEVTVTITYKSPKSKREISNSVTEYVIDYKKEINLPGLGGAGGGAGGGLGGG